MRQPECYQTLTLRGEIVETFVKDGQDRVRIAIHPCCIEALPTGSEELHLRDPVTIEARLTVSQMHLLPGVEVPPVPSQGE